ncbi:pyruvate:ferredoxin (flavodoxin) oxidoreductase [Cerasicoccus frondis]|uniref:pyruvate:ferredoxin (flavodoxin) oxidoreductase n=1 Tax=Cerasicoccus frondis TaxID=490090 RepID=UPI00285295D2|nr:pyruvate:ferredoxin (flavodoxin) oxidoreductase [Cerasicoccus frondis]
MNAAVTASRKTVDANEAVASVAYRLSELISIYPITPSTPMAELCDEWSAAEKPNLWNESPQVVQMQSEGGVAGSYHGILMGGCLSTTFTASQGLLLMIPVMYKLAGELTPTVMHVSARAIATNALSIFGDHSDVMACRQTGFAMLASNSVQEAQDMAAIAHAASLKTRLPFLHFFDGFRTSHELNSIEPIADDVLKSLLDEECLAAFYDRALTPDKPTVRGTAQNPDTYFQAREAVNEYYKDAPAIVQEVMDDFAAKTGRQYNLYDYYGHPEAESVIVMMGSGVETAVETCNYMNEKLGAKVGVVAVRLYRPFKTPEFLKCMPKTVKNVAVLDRTKEPGSIGEPLYLDVALAMRKGVRCPNQCREIDPEIVGGRYGIGSKEFTPAMVKAVYDNLLAERAKDHFTVGIQDDVTDTSLPLDANWKIESGSAKAAMFFGLGSDGTVGANKNTIKIIGEATDLHTQAYFVYDSKKSGGLTTSHLRFGPDPIKAPYLIDQAEFIACHQPQFLGRVDMLSQIKEGGVFLLNSPLAPDEVFYKLPAEVQQTLIEKRVKFHVIDAYKVAGEVGMGRRINTIMQVCFFALTDLLDTDQAIGLIKGAIEKTYGRKGPKIVEMNCAAVDGALAHLHSVVVPPIATAAPFEVKWVPDDAPDFVQRVTRTLLAGQGDQLPVSAFPVDGTWPSATSQYEKRRIASKIPVWDATACTQCNKCSLFCPHAAIRPKVYDKSELEGAPAAFRSTDFKGPNAGGKGFTIQVFPEDCTGCQACVELCPAKDANGRRAIEMEDLPPILEEEKQSLEFFQKINEEVIDPKKASPKSISLRQPLFEFSGACSGCTQTPYMRILTQLFGDRLLMANATGCSSIYGGNLPTTPYCTDKNGRGPAWANSLFEDNAEFGLGLHLASKRRTDMARAALKALRGKVDTELCDAVLEGKGDVITLRGKVEELGEALKSVDDPMASRVLQHLDYLVVKSTWIVGGDGWAYDIGYGGLDHVLASGHNVNVLVLDTEVYSNTGGQASKATPIGAQAKFAAAGKEMPKKDLGQIAISYGGIYVAQIALGANEQQALDVLREAESYDGPSLVIAYGPCLAHGIDLAHGPARQKAAVDTGYWPLYRFDPRNGANALPKMRLDSFEPSTPVSEFMQQENRFRSLLRSDPERAGALLTMAQTQVDERWKQLERLAAVGAEDEDDDDDGWG